MIYPPLIIPSIPSVSLKILEIVSQAELLQTVKLTFSRLIVALFIGSLAGFIIGVLGSIFRIIREILEPIIGILQVIPPVALLILAIIWFGFNGKPAIFIVIMAIFPTIVINVQQGILNIDPKILEMGKIFKLSRGSIFTNIIIPAIRPSLISAWKISLGLACKTMVMGEVLTTPTGIGGALSMARMDLEPENVIAWTVIMIFIFYFINNLPGTLKKIHMVIGMVFCHVKVYMKRQSVFHIKKTHYA